MRFYNKQHNSVVQIPSILTVTIKKKEVEIATEFILNTSTSKNYTCKWMSVGG